MGGRTESLPWNRRSSRSQKSENLSIALTGAAKYAADFNPPRMAYAFPVQATIATVSVWNSTLMEEAEFDQRFGNLVHRSLNDYHVSVQTDAPKIAVLFINKPDPHISPIGSRGAGQIGAIGISAAIANAIFNATGKRLRDLPLTPDKLF